MENGKEKSSDEQSLSSEISNSNEFLQISPHSGGLTSDQFDLLHEMILTKYEDLSIRYKETFACLEQTFEEVNLLSQENLKLRAENLDLSTLVAAKEKEFMSSVAEDELVSDFSQFGLGAYSESERERATARERSDVQKVAATDSSIPTRGSDVIPKVISVRSNAGGPAFVRNANHPQRLRLVAKSAQGGGKEKEVELEVYNQGMVKTELCNKWEETGECPYGERCQFAHGVQELRPVIRHPRYKTEICRMILNGGTCPYGHRCHFRHTLDPTEEQQVVL